MPHFPTFKHVWPFFPIAAAKVYQISGFNASLSSKSALLGKCCWAFVALQGLVAGGMDLWSGSESLTMWFTWLACLTMHIHVISMPYPHPHFADGQESKPRCSSGNSHPKPDERQNIQPPRKRSNSQSKVLLIYQWIGLRENLQETIDFPIQYGVFL